jgi:hypothetical protein
MTRVGCLVALALWTGKEAPISVGWVPFPTPTLSLSPPKKHNILLISFYDSFFIFICQCHRVPSLAHVNEKAEKKPMEICFPEDIIWSYVMFFCTLFLCNLIICDVFWTLFVCNWIFGGVTIFVTIFQQWSVQLITSFLQWHISSSENVSFNLLSILSNLVAAFFTLAESI